MGFFIFLMVVGIVVSAFANSSMNRELQNRACSVHKWEYFNGRLKCVICKRFPSGNTDENS